MSSSIHNFNHHKPSRDTENRVFFGAGVLIAINLALGSANLTPILLAIYLTIPILAFVVFYLYIVPRYHPEHHIQLVASLFVTVWCLQTCFTAWLICLLINAHH